MGDWDKMTHERPEILIENAELGDLAEILALQKLAYQKEAALYEAYDDMPPLTQTLAEICEEFGKRTFLKVVIDGRIIGSVRAHVDGEGACQIGRLMVHPDYQRRGIGSAMMAEVERHFGDAKRFVLFTGDRSAHNIRLYRGLGFEIYRTEQIRDGLAHVFMQKVAGAK